MRLYDDSRRRVLEGIVDVVPKMLNSVSPFAGKGGPYALLAAGLLALVAAVTSKFSAGIAKLTLEEFEALLIASGAFLFGGAVLEVVERRNAVKSTVFVTQALATVQRDAQEPEREREPDESVSQPQVAGARES